MIQTINRINSSDRRCLEVRFVYLENPEKDMNYDTHTFSYSDARKMFQEMGNKMGFEPLLFNGKTKLERILWRFK